MTHKHSFSWAPSAKNLKRSFTVFFFLGLASFACASKKAKVEHLPLPAKILEARTVYIENDTNQAIIGDKAYTQLKSWGRYQVTNEKDKADLVFVFTLRSSHTEDQSSQFVSLYNSKTESYTSGVVPGGSTTTIWNFTQIRVMDPASSAVMWADERPWLRKHSATETLIKDLRQRIDEQQSTGER